MWTPLSRVRVRMEVGRAVVVRFDTFRGVALLDGEERRIDGGVVDWAPAGQPTG